MTRTQVMKEAKKKAAQRLTAPEPRSSRASWWLYIIRCADDSLYTGITTDVRRRLQQHRAGQGARYLKGRGPLTLVHQRPAGPRSEALRLEAQVKRLSKAQKEKLVQGATP